MSKQLPGDDVDRLLPQIRQCTAVLLLSTLRLFMSHYLIYYLRVMLQGFLPLSDGM